MTPQQLKPLFGEIAQLLRIQSANSCATAGSQLDGNPQTLSKGFKSISIVKTSASGDIVTISLEDGTHFDLTEQGEVVVQAANPGGRLPQYVISGTGTWKWIALK